MKTKTKGVMNAAADAAIELGQAAESLKSSWAHIKRAQKRGKTAARPVVHAGKRVVRAAKKTTRRAVKKISRRR